MKNKSKKNFVLSLYEFEKFHTKYKKMYEGGNTSHGIKNILYKMEVIANKDTMTQNEMIEKCDSIISKAIREIIGNVFFKSVLDTVNVRYNFAVKTMATDGVQILINPYFVLTLDDPKYDVVFILTHELMHIIFNHAERLKNKKHSYWNSATDLTINDALTKMLKVSKPPAGGLYDPVKYGSDKMPDEIYDLLLKDPDYKPKDDTPPPPPPPGGDPPPIEPAVGDIVEIKKGGYGVITKVISKNNCEIEELSEEEAKERFYKNAPIA